MRRIFVIIFSVISLVYSDSSNWAYNIDVGQCSGTSRVQTDDVYKNAEPLTTKKTAYTWRGGDLFRISCIKVLNRMPHDLDAGETRISEGGVGHGDVKIEMRSKNSKHMHFIIEIWGEETGNKRSEQLSSIRYPLTNQNNRLTDRVMYVGEDRYCLCN